MDFPDIGLTHSWKRNDLPWETAERYSTGKPQPTDELVPEIVSELQSLLSQHTNSIHYAAAYSFLYLYLSLANSRTPGFTFTVRSALPIGAGLGSSASISVCLSAALSLLGNHINAASVKSEEPTTDNDDLTFIDSWSFMGEKCMHGNPSGIDNACATHGGAVMFQRMQSSVPSVRTTMRNFPKLKLLLTNTKHPRRTAELVGGVSRLTSKYPKTASNILDAIESLTREAYNLMIRPFLDQDAKSRMSDLFEMNHGLLVALGVSHPTLEKVRILTDEAKIGKTKLTGAGGGGCAITLVNDDVTEDAIHELSKKYEENGFTTYETTLGGKGVGYLSSSSTVRTAEEFKALETRLDIEKAMQVDTLENWRFW